jgi:fatty acid desaturase
MSSTSHYLHARQRADIHQLSQAWWWRLEMPTWVLMVTVYSGWFAVVYFWQTLGAWIATPLLVLFTTWYMSLQHELIHGHPTRKAWLNQLFGTLPLAVWYPYGLYRDSHLHHHRNDHLTLPEDDPEGYYFTRARWERFPAWFVAVIKLRNTLPGRMIVGPLLDIYATLSGALFALFKGEIKTIAMWVIHIAMLAVLLYWMSLRGLSPVYFVIAVSYPALSLTKLRSFFEHRAHEAPEARSTLNEAGFGWRLLFLNLNYHLVHHDLPGLPWYALRKVYLAEREAYIQRSEGFLVEGYSQWLNEHAVKPIHVEIHPLAPGQPDAPEVFSGYDYQQQARQEY